MAQTEREEKVMDDKSGPPTDEPNPQPVIVRRRWSAPQIIEMTLARDARSGSGPSGDGGGNSIPTS